MLVVCFDCLCVHGCLLFVVRCHCKVEFIVLLCPGIVLASVCYSCSLVLR